jgi:uncharacterized membrane protein YgcG
MDSQLEIKLIECLGRLDDGEPIDRILAHYPDDAAGLRPLLETAVALEELRPTPRESARIASRRAFLAQAHELRESASRRSWLPRRLAITITALIVAFIFVSGTVAVSASALPSEPLYGVKRAVEDVQLLVAAGAQKDQLAASFGQRRRDEINLLLVMRRDTAIAFEGTIEIIQPNGWEVSGLYIYFDPATTIAGTPAVGSHARIQGHTRAGQLHADSISVEPGGSPIASPTATVTPKPSATARPSLTPSRIPSPQPEATQRPKPTPQPEVTTQPEATAQREVTAQPRTTLQPTARPTLAPTRAPTSSTGPSTGSEGNPGQDDPPQPRSTTAPTSAPPTSVSPAAAPPPNQPPPPPPSTQESEHNGGGGDPGSGGGGGDNGGDHGGDDHGGGGGGDHGGGGDDRPEP